MFARRIGGLKKFRPDDFVYLVSLQKLVCSLCGVSPFVIHSVSIRSWLFVFVVKICFERSWIRMNFEKATISESSKIVRAVRNFNQTQIEC